MSDYLFAAPVFKWAFYFEKGTYRFMKAIPSGMDANGLVERKRLTELTGRPHCEVGALGDLVGQVAEARTQSVRQDEAGDDESHAQHDGECGHGESALVGTEIAEGQAEHREFLTPR